MWGKMHQFHFKDNTIEVRLKYDVNEKYAYKSLSHDNMCFYIALTHRK